MIKRRQLVLLSSYNRTEYNPATFTHPSQKSVYCLQVISYSDGSCEIHYLNQYLSKQQENEEQRFADLLNSIIY